MNESKKKILEGLLILIFCCCPIIVITGCGAGSCVRCTACGDDDTRFFVYASGTTSDGLEYTSCVGPAGCVGLGLNTFFWPTECISIKGTSDFSDSQNISGCVTYYNEAGCIGKSGVKSKGTYTDSVSVFGINCGGTKYVETVAESTKAYEQGSCLGCTCGEKDNDVELRDYNNSMPRSFTKGCWTSD